MACVTGWTYGIVLNGPVQEEYAATMMSQFNIPVPTLFHDWSAGGGSTDFGNVTYALPSWCVLEDVVVVFHVHTSRSLVTAP